AEAKSGSGELDARSASRASRASSGREIEAKPSSGPGDVGALGLGHVVLEVADGIADGIEGPGQHGPRSASRSSSDGDIEAGAVDLAEAKPGPVGGGSHGAITVAEEKAQDQVRPASSAAPASRPDGETDLLTPADLIEGYLTQELSKVPPDSEARSRALRALIMGIVSSKEYSALSEKDQRGVDEAIHYFDVRLSKGNYEIFRYSKKYHGVAGELQPMAVSHYRLPTWNWKIGWDRSHWGGWRPFTTPVLASEYEGVLKQAIGVAIRFRDLRISDLQNRNIGDFSHPLFPASRISGIAVDRAKSNLASWKALPKSEAVAASAPGAYPISAGELMSLRLALEVIQDIGIKIFSSDHYLTCDHDTSRHGSAPAALYRNCDLSNPEELADFQRGLAAIETAHEKEFKAAREMCRFLHVMDTIPDRRNDQGQPTETAVDSKLLLKNWGSRFRVNMNVPITDDTARDRLIDCFPIVFDTNAKTGEKFTWEDVAEGFKLAEVGSGKPGEKLRDLIQSLLRSPEVQGRNHRFADIDFRAAGLDLNVNASATVVRARLDGILSGSDLDYFMNRAGFRFEAPSPVRVSSGHPVNRGPVSFV
ncbi:hypothetical protein EBR96_06375, partial [bacterium]|nr:hypothetical protein [bacterium]